MKFRFLRIFALAFSLLMLLASCSKVPALELKEGDVYVNKKTKISYTNTSTCYRANAYSAEPTARIKLKNMEEKLLYSIDGMDGSKWLCDSDYMVYCAEGEKAPELWEMNISKVYINKTVNASYTVASILEPADIQALINVYQNGRSFAYEDLDDGLAFKRYDLVFADEHLSYYLIYLQYEQDVLFYDVIDDPDNFTVQYPGVEVTTEEYKGEYYAVYNFGKHLMYNRETGLCYPVSDTLNAYFAEE